MTRLAGLWQRLLLALPGEPIDTLTRVDWLQGPVLYVDLRQDPTIAHRVAARCLADLTIDEARLLARQEGFAGRFVLAGDEAEWLREIDFRPCPLGDRGRLEEHGDLLIETGIEAEYIEHWQREPAGVEAVSGAARFVAEDDGRAAILVRHGQRFAYARSRAIALAPGELETRLATASAAQARALVDCEISLGTVSASGWRIERSSLPWRVGKIMLGAGAAIAGGQLDLADVAADGSPLLRRLRLVGLHGSLLPGKRHLAQHEPPRRAAPAATDEPFQSVPVIDIAALGSGDAAAEDECVAAIRDAASSVGFLMVTGHGIAPAVIKRLKSATRRFFDQPLAAKLACYIGKSANHRGYVPEGEEQLGEPGEDAAARRPDRKEAFDLALDLAPGAVPDGHPMLGPNQWPDLPGFREDVMAYYGAVFAVGRRLLRAFALALGQPADSFERLVTAPPSQLRLIHYPHDAANGPGAADASGIGAHTDYEFFTLLLATGPGLEVMNQAGEWIDAPPVPGALVVNIGDMLECWSGGAFVATSHRVRKVAEERWSFPLFFALDYDVELRPLGREEAAPIRTGEHLYAQTVQTFRYLKERAAAGVIALPPSARPLSSFGQVARHSIPGHAQSRIAQNT